MATTKKTTEETKAKAVAGVELTCLAIGILRKLENMEKRLWVLDERLRDTERVVRRNEKEIREVVQRLGDVADACEEERRRRQPREGRKWLEKQPPIPYTC